MKLITTFAIASGSYLFFSILSKKYVNQVLRNKGIFIIILLLLLLTLVEDF